MNKLDKRTELIQKLQAELDRRTGIENEAIQLMREGEYAQATELLASLDDSVIKGINEELDRLETEGQGDALEELQMTVVRISIKHTKLLEKRIDNAGSLSGNDLRDVYSGIQMLGHVVATLERFSRMTPCSSREIGGTLI